MPAKGGSKVKVNWMKKQPAKKQIETQRRAYSLRMGKPKGLSPMAQAVADAEVENPKMTPAERVDFMYKFQEEHCEGKTRRREVAVLKKDGKVYKWFACDICGCVSMATSQN